jgi:hypothetical protein
VPEFHGSEKSSAVKDFFRKPLSKWPKDLRLSHSHRDVMQEKACKPRISWIALMEAVEGGDPSQAAYLWDP